MGHNFTINGGSLMGFSAAAWYFLGTDRATYPVSFAFIHPLATSMEGFTCREFR